MLAVVSLLGGPRAPLLPLPGPNQTADAVNPIDGPPAARSSDPVFPRIPGDPTATPALPSTPLPWDRATAGSNAQEDAKSRPGGTRGVPTPGPAEQSTRPGHPATVKPPTGDERTIPPRPSLTPPPTQPSSTTTPSPPPTRPPGTPSPTPSGPPNDPEQPDDPTLTDHLLALLDLLTP